jgi:hypothetical protein
MLAVVAVVLMLAQQTGVLVGQAEVVEGHLH